tara:strand:- start:3918 stop:4361 length:444 start_codon:yes stop_codon:yes gene_type:complete
MQIINIKKYHKNYKNIYNHEYWNRFIGDEEFCQDFLKQTFSFERQHYFLLLDENNKNQIEGILVYEKIPGKSIYKIILIAKREKSDIKGVGKKFIRFLQRRISRSILILVDDSGIPDYYTELGFFICNNRLKNYLEPTSKTCYYKII